MRNIIILEFVERDDFIAELNARTVRNMRCEISVETGEPRGELGNAPITAYAIATALVTISDGISAIIRWQTTILFTDALSHQMDKEKTREKMFGNFDKVRAEFVELGFSVSRGQWKVN